jgi:hypothetical protein
LMEDMGGSSGVCKAHNIHGHVILILGIHQENYI